jgi:Xaa-Pro aminopeptidase
LDVARGDVEKVKEVLRQFGLTNEAVGVDIVEMPSLNVFAKEGIFLVNGRQVSLEAPRRKTSEEIALMTHAASMVDAACEGPYSFLRPGVKELLAAEGRHFSSGGVLNNLRESQSNLNTPWVSDEEVISGVV